MTVTVKNNIPVLSTAQIREVDRLMIERYGIQLIQMMENAGRNLALLVRRSMGESVENRRICVAIGNGNNGGGGLVAARHLSNWGAEVTVLVATPDTIFKPVAALQLEIVRHIPVSVVFAGQINQWVNLQETELIIDAVFGYGLNRPPEGIAAGVIDKINGMSSPVISLDTPSGLNTSNGNASPFTVRADKTLTLALPKNGLLMPKAREYVGELLVADISVPPLLYCELGIEVPPLFDEDTIVPVQ